MRLPTAPALLVAAALFPGCDARGPYDQDEHAGHTHEPAAPAEGGHHHVAPHGGVLVALESEVFNAELLLDPATGKLDLWFLDGEAENGVQVKAEEVVLSLNVGTVAETLTLTAVEDALAGDTRTASSHFSGRSDTLRGAARFGGTLRSVRLGSRAYQNVAFEYASPSK
jgi:hypothetical protein